MRIAVRENKTRSPCQISGLTGNINMETRDTCQPRRKRSVQQLARERKQKEMNVKVEMFRDKEFKDSIALRNKEFSIDIETKYSYSRKPDGSIEIDETFAREFVKEASKKVSINLDAGTPNRDDGFPNLEVEDSEWDCKESIFSVQLRYCGVCVLLKSDENGNMVIGKDKSKPDEIFYLKGTIEQ